MTIHRPNRVQNVVDLATALCQQFEDKGYRGRGLFLATIELLARTHMDRAVEVLDILDENVVQVAPRRQGCPENRKVRKTLQGR